MSGFEAIGLVLAVWPLVVNGFSLYKTAKGGLGMELLVNRVKMEEAIYEDFVRHLLAADVSETELCQLSDKEKPDLKLWRSEVLHAKLRERLGENRSQIVLTTCREMKRILTDLRNQLDVDSNISASHGKIRNSLRYLRHNLPQSSISKSLDDLDFYNTKLKVLVTNCTNPGYPAQGKIPSATALFSQELLQQIKKHAGDIHNAICEGYRCKCQIPHQANLGLRNVTPLKLESVEEEFELLFPIDDPFDNAAARLSEFSMASPTSTSDKSLSSGSLESADSFILGDTKQFSWSPRNSISSLVSPITTRSNSTYKEQRGRSISFSESRNENDDTGQIEDLCNFIKNLEADSEVPTSASGVLGLTEKKYTVKAATIDEDSPSRSIVSLDEYLTSSKGSKLTRRKRMDLSLMLSITLLQFITTPWIDMWWTWKDFAVLQGEKSQIFVSKKFYSKYNPVRRMTPTHSQLTSAFWDCIGEPELTRLGFALIELAMGKRLSELADEENDPSIDQDMMDYRTAKYLMDTGAILEEAGQCYHDVVQACLTHQVIEDAGVRPLNSKNITFQSDLERFVVAPMRDYYSKTWQEVASC
ncbi:hypothetical protein F5884DRAFT_61394 [Xylogone sp. PMI_703]|nr:hypothetical protein F5884DRAFT_61394 [Xylogone sp. PMI_703]